MSRKERAAQTLPFPWEGIFRVGESLADHPALEAAIHRDERLSANAKGLLIAALSLPTNAACSASLLARQGNYESVGQVNTLLKELYNCDYLRLEDNQTADIIGAHPDATKFAFTYVGLFPATPLMEAVASAQHFFFPEPELVEA